MTVKSKLSGMRRAKLEKIADPSESIRAMARQRTYNGVSTCCGLRHYNGLEWITTPQHARALQEAAEVGILVTVMASQKVAMRCLLAAGFVVVAKWNNPNTNRIITMMMGPGTRVNKEGIRVFTKIEGVNDGKVTEDGEQEATPKPKARAASSTHRA